MAPVWDARPLGLLVEIGVLGAEFFHTAGFYDTRLSARVEGMAFRGRIQLHERIGHAVNFNGFFRLSGGLDDERLVDGQVAEGHVAIFGVNTLFHLLYFLMS
jgi:hypothetical protein